MARRRAARHLTPRDRQILGWVGQAGLASLDQLARFGWAGRCLRTAQDRLTQLVKAGYLQVTTCDARQPGERVYTLTRQGRLQFPAAERERLQVGLPPPQERQQQLLAQDAYLRLATEAAAAGGALIYWRTERELRGAFRRAQQQAARAGQPPPTGEIPDGQAVFTTATGQIEEIDVEIDGQYYGRMLHTKAARFGQGGRPTLWVCTAARARAVTRATQDYPNIQLVVL
jgi:hypothetical protein